MAYVYSLLNDDTTLALNDLTNYVVRQQGVATPPPRLRTLGGTPLLPSLKAVLDNPSSGRTVTLTIDVRGTSTDNLIANISNIHALLARAEEFSRHGLNSQVKLRRQWDSATNALDFHVVRGTFETQEGTALQTVNTRVTGTLILTCKPFAYGTQETISNFVGDPSFEIAGTALADWTASIHGSAAGTTARDTTQAKYGAACLKLVMTNSGGSGQQVERNQSLGDVDAAEIWSFGVWVYVTALSNCKFVLDIEYTGGSSTSTVERTTTSTGWIQLKIENETVPSSTTAAVFKPRLESTAGSATGTAYVDGCMAVQATSIPSTWVSGRAVVNHMDDDGQAHINYLDVYDCPGDVPALCQMKLAEDQTHQLVWVGARHAGRQTDEVVAAQGMVLEGEDGVTTQVHTNSVGGFNYNMDETEVDANASAGNSNRNQLSSSADPTNPNDNETWFRTDWTIASPPRGQYKVLIRASNGGNTADAATNSLFTFMLGWSYGGVNLLDQTNPDRASAVALTDVGSGSAGQDTAEDYQLLDLGTVTIPPVTIPDNQTGAAFKLQVYQSAGVLGNIAEDYTFEWYIDCVLLMPIDFSGVFLTKATGTDVILLDSLTEPGGVWLLNTSDVVQSFPTDQLGSPPVVHPDGTRFYFQCRDGVNDVAIADGYKIALTVQPLYLLVRKDD